ncbi:uncharacterized protein F5147DRAFT_706829 [Suillus discolor]|uniref:Cysteine-rich protein n=1 Tax=Suillus discolor TaxID=1912936 RepID=A0A9P7JRZ3_9AGAM|nr:uncharacterized protein F5147DRAFT_706829 [Suillus discolor]KAG2102811.1 hypothetical protein F5147DRAFT_706829 [Suillus discolor]
MNFKSLALLLTAAAVPQVAVAGPLAYGICQTGCNGLAVACYAGAGFTFGVALPLAPPVLIACNVALGSCMVACATVVFAPTL